MRDNYEDREKDIYIGRYGIVFTLKIQKAIKLSAIRKNPDDIK